MEGNVAKKFIYRDTDHHHGNSDLMILSNDYKHYCKIVSGFLFGSSICEEAEDVGNDTYCCVAIPKEFHSIIRFLYEERSVQRRHINVYKSVLYILCDALCLEKTRHNENITFPQLRTTIIQWWY